MDLRYFLGERLAFTEQLYNNCSAPYIDRQRKIEAEEEPYIPPYSEDGDPPFLEEWLEAEESLQVIGRTCISMLSASLHLYLKHWEKQLGRSAKDSYESAFKKRGWFHGYREYFKGEFNVLFEKSPCDLTLLEELTLARNRVQHPESITMQSSHYSRDDLGKLPNPFFVDEAHRNMLNEGEWNWLMPPVIHVTPDKLRTAIAEISRFAQWLEETDH